MNDDDERFELIRRYVDGNATAEHVSSLAVALSSDPDFRKEFIRYANIDSAIGHRVSVPELSQNPSRSSEPSIRAKTGSIVQVFTVAVTVFIGVAMFAGFFLRYQKSAKVRSAQALIQKIGIGLAQYQAELRSLPPDTGYGLPLNGPMSGRTYDAGALWRYLGRPLKEKVTGRTLGPYLNFTQLELKPYTDSVYGKSFMVVDQWGNPVGYIGDPKRVIHNHNGFDLFSAGPDGKTACNDGIDNDGDGVVDNPNHAYDGTGKGDASEMGESALNGTLTGSKRKSKPGEVLDDINNWDPQY